ncbi:MAG TPA: ABC transporter permease [Bryobacteraceae bacterium]|nr:ABC transporter permease [Bryobacteraceae bacterium]
MTSLRAFLARLWGLFRSRQSEQDRTDEIESNLAFHVEDNIRAGMTAEEARRQAILKLGGIQWAKEGYREQSTVPSLESFFYDLRYAARSLSGSWTFTVMAVGTLAFGIAAATVIFTIGKAVFAPPLPYARPDRLVGISMVDPHAGSTGSNVASGDVADWKHANTVFSDIAEYVGIDERGKARVNLLLTGAEETKVLSGLVVSNNFLDVLGVAPILGRNFGKHDVDHVAIISFHCWRQQFGADSHIIGRSVKLDGASSEVIGVLPRGFFFPDQEFDVLILPGEFTPTRIFHDEGAIARLRPGVSLDEAKAQMAGIHARLQRAYPETDASLGVRVEGWRYALASPSRAALLMLISAVAILFLIVCANVAHLQFGRSASRLQDFSIRKALGANRARLFRQLLTESLLLSLLGGLLGFCLAQMARVALLQFAPEAIPLYADLRIDTSVIAFCLGITLLASMLFGVGPALASARNDPLRHRGWGASSVSSTRLRSFLVCGEVALSVVLVVCAGLLIRSFLRLENVDLGFRSEHSVSFRLDPSSLVSSEAEGARLFAEIENRLLQQPGIDSMGATVRPILGGGGGGEPTVTILGRKHLLRLELVTPGYFRAMQTPLLNGRFLAQSDSQKSALVVVVNSAFERTYFPDKNTLGKQIILGGRGPAMIVGVVADLKQEGIDQPAQPAAFASSNQILPRAATFIVRGRGDTRALLETARSTVHSVNKLLPLTNIASLDELVRSSISGPRLRTSLLSLAAGAALFLAALGIYGVMAYSVVQRSTEISIRMALGASLSELFEMVVVDGMRPVMIGAALGFAGAYVASGLIRSLLFGIVPTDPAAYLWTALVLAAVSLCASIMPALKAIRMDPMITLRRQ